MQHGRTIRCMPDAGWELEADTKHVKTLLQWFECEDARGSPVPGSKDARRPLEHETEIDGTITVLDQEEHAEYRKHVGLLQYIANDRFDLKYAVKEVRSDAARPTVVSRRMVKKIVRESGAVLWLERARRHSRGHNGRRSCRLQRDAPQQIQRGYPGPMGTS